MGFYARIILHSKVHIAEVACIPRFVPSDGRGSGGGTCIGKIHLHGEVLACQFNDALIRCRVCSVAHLYHVGELAAIVHGICKFPGFREINDKIRNCIQLIPR